jgi:hypothetical protein
VKKLYHQLQDDFLQNRALLTARDQLVSMSQVLEVVDTGGWCASRLGMGPEYPGLDESVEHARWRFLHWIQ